MLCLAIPYHIVCVSIFLVKNTNLLKEHLSSNAKSRLQIRTAQIITMCNDWFYEPQNKFHTWNIKTKNKNSNQKLHIENSSVINILFNIYHMTSVHTHTLKLDKEHTHTLAFKRTYIAANHTYDRTIISLCIIHFIVHLFIIQKA